MLLSHKFLAEMLGVQRSTVSAITRTLQNSGLIKLAAKPTIKISRRKAGNLGRRSSLSCDGERLGVIRLGYSAPTSSGLSIQGSGLEGRHDQVVRRGTKLGE